MRAANELRMRQAHQLDVVDVTALAGNETAVFLAHDACANAFNAHVLSSQPELLFPPFPSRRGGLEYGFAGLRRVFRRPRGPPAAGRRRYPVVRVFVAGVTGGVGL